MLKVVKRLLLLLLLQFTAFPVWALKHESRAIFEESFSWETPQGTDLMLARIQRAGFNVLIPRVWVGAGSFWPSNQVPSADRWKYRPDPNYDPLQNLIEKAHALGIEVHPWFTVMMRWKEFYKDYYDQGTPAHLFNVHVPEFRTFIVDVMLEVVQNYDVDGINLDVIRSGGFCNSVFCAKDYKRRFNRDLLADIQIYKTTNHFKVESTEIWPVLRDWNRQAVTDIVRNFSEKARKIKPQLIISVDTIVLIEGFNIQGADAINWSNKGWVDVIYHMDYSKSPRNRLLHNARKKLKKTSSLVLLTGNVDWPDDDQRRGNEAFSREPQLTANILTNNKTTRCEKNGKAMWTYGFLTDEQIVKISEGPFKEPAIPFWVR